MEVWGGGGHATTCVTRSGTDDFNQEKLDSVRLTSISGFSYLSSDGKCFTSDETHAEGCLLIVEKNLRASHAGLPSFLSHGGGVEALVSLIALYISPLKKKERKNNR